MHPERFLDGSVDAPTAVGFRGEAPPGWTLVYADDLGELEIRVLLREFLPDREAADRAAAGWDGDAFRLLDAPSGEVFVWVSVWDSDRDALEFERAVASALAARYGDDPAAAGRQLRIVRGGSGDRPTVAVWDLPAALAWTDEITALAVVELDEADAVSDAASGTADGR
jgi:hypothetical protein